MSNIGNTISVAAPTADEIDARISEKLRKAFSDILEEPIPERFIALLDELAKADENE